MIKFSRKQLRIPYLVFLLVFVVLPLFVILYYALTNGEGQFTWENFREFFVDGKTMGTLLYSLMIAVTTTIVCLLIAYHCLYTGTGQSETGTGLCDFACDANVD